MTMKALYWGLINHCEEKWKAWNAALIWMANSLIKMARMFNITPLPDIEYTVSTDHATPSRTMKRLSARMTCRKWASSYAAASPISRSGCLTLMRMRNSRRLFARRGCWETISGRRYIRNLKPVRNYDTIFPMNNK